MKTKFYLFVLIISFLCLASDCGRYNRPTYYMPQDFKDYVMYPVGSYWVYEDSISGETDSIVLTEQETFIEEPGHVWDFYWENISHEFYSSYNTQLGGGGGIYCEHPLVYSYSSGWGQYLSTENGLSSIDDYEYFYYDSLKINEKWYYNVKYYYDKCSGTSYFWALGIGVFRKNETLNNKVWNLKSYHINN